MYLGDTFIYKDPVVSYCLLLALGEFTHERVAVVRRMCVDVIKCNSSPWPINLLPRTCATSATPR